MSATQKSFNSVYFLESVYPSWPPTPQQAYRLAGQQAYMLAGLQAYRLAGLQAGRPAGLGDAGMTYVWD